MRDQGGREHQALAEYVPICSLHRPAEVTSGFGRMLVHARVLWRDEPVVDWHSNRESP